MLVLMCWCSCGGAHAVQVVKSMVQGRDGARYAGMSSGTIMRQIVATNGVLGLWRGILPGALRSIASNGAGMAVYQVPQTYIRTYVHTYIRTCVHACIPTYLHAYAHACMHTWCSVYQVTQNASRKKAEGDK